MKTDKSEKTLKKILELLEDRLPSPERDLDLELELDVYDMFTHGMLELGSLAHVAVDTDIPKMFKNKSVEIEVDTSELSDWLESMKYIIADYNSYEEEDYYYVVLPDPNNTDNLIRVLMRNENYDPVIEGIYLAPGEDMLDIMFEDGNFDFLFTEEEIKASHPYLWECRKAF